MSLTSQHGKSTQVLYGIYDFSNFLNQISMPQSIDEVETTTFGATAKTFIVGFRDGKVTGSGFFDQTATTGSDPVLSGDLGASSDKPLTIVPTGGATLGDRAYVVNSRELNYTVDAGVADAVKIKAEWRADGGIDYGRVLHPLGVESTTTNGSAYNHGASTSNGGVGNLHCTVQTGSSPTLAVRVQDSADGSTGWATILTFTTISGSGGGSENKAITGTVRQYTRADWTVGGTGGPTSTFAMAFARR